MQGQSKLEKLTMKDNFMFGAVMINPENCKPFLEMALGIHIKHLSVSTEKSLVYHPEYRGVRLDVEASDDEKNRYNVEMQVIKKPFLEHRARYYHSQIDMDLLRTGKGYGSLPDVYVIFVCDFDPFGLGKYQYTFRNICLENNCLTLRDGLTTMFLSTHGTDKEKVSDELIHFLQYVGADLQTSNGEFQDGYVRQLQAAVRQVKSSREMEARYMLLEELLSDEREVGRTEGLVEAVFGLLQELPGQIPETLKEQILKEKNNEMLKRYLKAASLADSAEAFTTLLSQ